MRKGAGTRKWKMLGKCTNHNRAEGEAFAAILFMAKRD